jgi:imidazole glycerol-phosphate synthase subunit HisH
VTAPQSAPSAAEPVSVRPLRVGIIDYGAGNLVSVEQALIRLGAQPAFVHAPDALADVDALIVPGVGASLPAMERLAAAGLVDPLRAWARAGRPLLGICLGMQLLFETSDEDGAEMLGVFPGRITLLQDAPTLPHIGWNQVERTAAGRSHLLFDGLPDAADFYFVHSYGFAPGLDAPDDLVLATTTHGRPMASVVGRGLVIGVQFHPERSGSNGLRLLESFVALAGTGVPSPSASAAAQEAC